MKKSPGGANLAISLGGGLFHDLAPHQLGYHALLASKQILCMVAKATRKWVTIPDYYG